MDFETLVRTRRSVRGYKTDPVPKEIIQEIIDVAKGAPSSMNTQPWNLYVVTGEPLNKIRQGNTERMLAGVKPHTGATRRACETEHARYRRVPWAYRYRHGKTSALRQSLSRFSRHACVQRSRHRRGRRVSRSFLCRIRQAAAHRRESC